MKPESLNDASMFELYRLEADDQTRVLTASLLELEREPTAPEHLEACMRAAHSLKGAARIIRFETGVGVAHVMEDGFVSAQRGEICLLQRQIDELLRGADLLRRMAHTSVESLNDPAGAMAREAASFQSALSEALSQAPRQKPAPQTNDITPVPGDTLPDTSVPPATDDRMLRVTAEHLDRLLRLAGESLVESRRLKQGVDLSHRLYEAALACRMRPFADGTHGFARMVRDLSQSLGKQARLELIGRNTPVDRDVLERLEAPLGHLLRNAVDHGLETPEKRIAAGKPAEGVVRVEARHSAGQLLVIVSDDGCGIPTEELRAKVVRHGLAPAETASQLTDAELLEFLFLPGFTMKETVSDISGRGVGLDAVQDTLKKIRGTVRISTQPGQGTRFQLQLPLTLSVVRTLLVQIGTEPYALPLAQIVRTARIPGSTVEFLEGRPHFSDGGKPTGLVAGRRVIRGEDADLATPELNIVVLGSRERTFALVIDRFLGECELLVHTLDPRLGKVQDVAAAGVMADGSPVLILDVEDLIRSIEKLATEGRIGVRVHAGAQVARQRARRVLVVDDSLTVREVQRKLLVSGGYEVEVATDGMDGWNAVRTGAFDLVITDVDMPRMDGIGLVTLIRKDPHVKSLPIMIISYKDRPEDRRRGLDAGADHYLAKGSFHDTALLDAVHDLIGEAAA